MLEDAELASAMTQNSDAVLWLEATSGTEASFAALFRRHQTRVFRKAYARVQDVADAEDIVAIVFLEAWRNRAKVRIVEGSILPWLLTVTTYVTLNTARSARRYRRLLHSVHDSTKTADPTSAVDERIDRELMGASISRAMQSLSRNDQIVLELCLVEEMPLAAAAAVLDIPIGTVKSRLHRARERLQKHLQSSPDFAQHALINLVPEENA
ncbi:RNA polymerase sigma factor [Naasia lichenicola]|uniref:RNA polymerase sigma factor n=1 Tax=Naasia lichenicola TaxID=2565933 RepID=A0A4S4FTG8_9MICO|nr:RNA polymerase sigma factor [Naasia lichenicola]THG33252.1 RNA polymerase sigma factor [Naasia lichenicola]